MSNIYFIVTTFIIFDSLLRRKCYGTIIHPHDGIKRLSISSTIYAIITSIEALSYGCDMKMVLTNVVIIIELSIMAWIISNYDDLRLLIISAIPTAAAIVVTLNYDAKLALMIQK